MQWIAEYKCWNVFPRGVFLVVFILLVDLFFQGVFLVGRFFCLLVCLPLEVLQVTTIVDWWNMCSAESSLKVRVQPRAFSVSQLRFVCLCTRLFLLWQCLTGCGWIPQSSGMSSVTSCNFNCCPVRSLYLRFASCFTFLLLSVCLLSGLLCLSRWLKKHLSDLS